MCYLELIPTIGKSIKSFTVEFVVKKNDVPKIMGKSTFTTVKSLLEAIGKNPIGMYNPRNPLYGKMHLINNTSQLGGGPAQQILPSADQGRPIPYVHPTTVQQ